jgi:predicted negative regulator of RcsB-dependent stress response
VEIYTTEEQQVEAIKKWWQENGNFVIVGVIVGLASISGWRYYQESQISAKEAASDGYQAIQTSVDAKGFEAAAEMKAYVESHKGDNYSFMAALHLAKLSVETENFAEALAQLNYVVENAKSDNPLFPVAVMRLARLQLAQGEYDAALATLENNALATSFAAVVEELKGDIYVAKGGNDKALIAYQAAVAKGGLENNPVLQSKINQLSVISAAQ